MRGALSAGLLCVAASSGAAAQDVQIDFDAWPDVPCAAPGMDACERAWVEQMPADPSDMTVASCGTGGCLEVGWTQDQMIRRVRTSWAPEGPVTTAYLEVRLRFDSSYLSEMSSTGWANPFYQPLARLHGEVPEEFGVDLSVIHFPDQPPVVALVSAPDSDAAGGVRLNMLEEACVVELPTGGEWMTIQASIDMTPLGGHACQLSINGTESSAAGLDFGSFVDTGRQLFASASFLGRVSNDSASGECDVGWPPCGGPERRGLIVDDLCVSDRLEAGDDGTCEPGTPLPTDGGALADTGEPSGDTTFRGVGGCACRAGPPVDDADWAVLLVAALVAGIRRRPRSLFGR